MKDRGFNATYVMYEEHSFWTQEGASKQFWFIGGAI